MSLINDMLRDLERRDVPPPARPVYGIAFRRKNRWLRWLVPIGALGAVVALAVPLLEPGRGASKTPVPDTPLPAAAAEPSSSPPNAPARAASTSPTQAVMIVAPAPTGADPVMPEPARATIAAPEPVSAPPPAMLAGSESPPARPTAARADTARIDADRTGSVDAAPAAGVGEAAGAGAESQTATATDPPAPEIIIRRATADRDRASETMDSARRALARGRPGVAIAGLEALLDQQPDNSEALVLLARTLAASGQGRAAEQRLADRLATGDSAPEAAIWLARLRLERGARIEALEVLKHHAPPVAGHVDHHLLLAATLREAGRHGSALEVYREITAVRPDNGRAWLGVALSLEALSQPDEARLAYREVLGADHSASANFARRRIEVLGPEGGPESGPPEP